MHCGRESSDRSISAAGNCGRALKDRLHSLRTTAAYEVGYESVSQFSREYNRCFGQPPIRDIKGLKANGTAEVEAV